MLRIDNRGQKVPGLKPNLVKWQIYQDNKNNQFAVPSELVQGKEELSIPGAHGPLKKLDIIRWVKAIDWSTDHCIFSENLNRVFTLGLNTLGPKGFIDKFKN